MFSECRSSSPSCWKHCTRVQLTSDQCNRHVLGNFQNLERFGGSGGGQPQFKWADRAPSRPGWLHLQAEHPQYPATHSCIMVSFYIIISLTIFSSRHATISGTTVSCQQNQSFSPVVGNNNNDYTTTFLCCGLLVVASSTLSWSDWKETE